MTNFLYADEDITLSWEMTEQYRLFTFFAFPKFAMQHFFKKFSWFAVGHKAVKLKVVSRNNSYKTKQMCHSRLILDCQKKVLSFLINS